MKIRVLLFALIITGLNSCTKSPSKYIYNQGVIHGAPYKIVYESPQGKDFQEEIDILLNELNMVFSVYEKESVISKVNRNEDVKPGPYFTKCFNRAMEVSEISDGALDITCGPMVNAWGFGPKTEKKKMTQETVDSLILLTGYKKVKLENGKVIKENPNMKLDMNALCDGYFCDVIAEFLAKKGCLNYLVEIGGEVAAKGKNEKSNIWSVGINKPEENAMYAESDLQTVILLKDKALATSGNYRNFYIEDGKKYAHTIDPKSGYPVQHNLLSATVVTDDGLSADAFATAFLVVGLEAAIELLEKVPGVEIYLIYSDEQGNNKVYMSEGFKEYIRD